MQKHQLVPLRKFKLFKGFLNIVSNAVKMFLSFLNNRISQKKNK